MITVKLLFFCALLVFAECAKILVVFPVPARSHYHLGNALARGLAERGHDVTMISPYAEKNPPKNGTYRDVQLTGVVELFEARRKDMNMFDRADSSPLIGLIFITKMTSEMTELVWQHPAVQKLLNSGEKFDAVIVEQFMNDGLKVLAKHFNAVLINFSTVGANSWVNPLVGNPAPLSYIPEMLSDYSSQMSFSERVKNVLFYLYGSFFQNFIVYPEQNRQLKQYLSKDYDLNDVLYNSSIVLLNSHPAMNQPVPYVPSMIDIGGFHVKPTGKLPEDLQKFLDNAKDGVVYFSMGSNLKSADMPIEKRTAILNVLSKLKMQVLWKFEEENLPGKPANLKISSWFPQQEILAHKNVKVFITHGGLLSTTETIYHGVPILAIPIFGDQKINANNAVLNGIGVTLPYTELNEESFEKKLKEVLNNQKYAENAKKRSKIFHDRETKPMDRAAFWVEYAIRHKGASHLRVAGVDLPWYRYMLVDVIAFLAVVCSVILYINYIIAKKILCKLFGGKCQQQKKKLKKN